MEKGECRADGLVPMRFAIFRLHLSKALRLPKKKVMPGHNDYHNYNFNFATLHYTSLHITTLTTLQYITPTNTSTTSNTLDYTYNCNYNYHYATLHYTTLNNSSYTARATITTALVCTTLGYTIVYHTTLHNTTGQYIGYTNTTPRIQLQLHLQLH